MATRSESPSQSQKKETKESIGDGKTPKLKKASSMKLRKKSFSNNVVYLYQFTRTPRLPSLSCYCLKVETFLRLVGINYENVDHKMKYRSSKGQLPFVEVNGEHIADSCVIIEELSKKFNRNMDIWLTDEQRSVSHAICSMLDNHLAWVVMWWRSKHPSRVLKGYKVDLQHALGTKVPRSILNFFFKSSFKRKGKKKVKAQGMGSHSSEEITELGKKDLQMLETFLGEKEFFFGNRPTTLDVVAFAHLAQIYFIDEMVNYPLREFLVKSCSNLVRLVIRMKLKCFPDWEFICSTLDLNTHLKESPKSPK